MVARQRTLGPSCKASQIHDCRLCGAEPKFLIMFQGMQGMAVFHHPLQVQKIRRVIHKGLKIKK